MVKNEVKCSFGHTIRPNALAGFACILQKMTKRPRPPYSCINARLRQRRRGIERARGRSPTQSVRFCISDFVVCFSLQSMQFHSFDDHVLDTYLALPQLISSAVTASHRIHSALNSKSIFTPREFRVCQPHKHRHALLFVYFDGFVKGTRLETVNEEEEDSPGSENEPGRPPLWLI